MEWMVYEGQKELDPKLIEEFEELCDYQYPESFKDVVIKYDGCSPEECNVFDTKETKERVFDSLISFVKDEGDFAWNVWEMLDEKGAKRKRWDIEGLKWKYVPFADDPFGNSICFDRTNDHVVFWDHETRHVEEIADTFEEFINCLYKDEEDDFFFNDRDD